MVGFSLLLPLFICFSLQIFYPYFCQCIIVVKKIRKTNIEWVEWVEKCRWFSTISKSQGLQSIPIYLMSMSRVVDSTIYFLGGDGVANISLWARTFLLILCFVISFYLLFRFSFSFFVFGVRFGIPLIFPAREITAGNKEMFTKYILSCISFDKQLLFL